MTNTTPKPQSEVLKAGKIFVFNKFGLNEGIDPFEDELANSVKDDHLESFLAGVKWRDAWILKKVQELAFECYDRDTMIVKLDDLKQLLTEREG